MRDVIWTVAHPTLTGAERCRLSRAGPGWRLAGQVVASHEGTPLDTSYEIELDAAWLSQSVRVAADRLAAKRALELVRGRDGQWTVDGAWRPELDGCTDVDLGVSPSTNTLPIRRLRLDVGQQADVHVAWVRFPSLEVDAGRQRYARVGASLWRYASEGFTADLTVDHDGLVITYGEDLWRRLTG